MPAEVDFIVIGSGAGGGPLACNLALAPEGFRVALLEAGDDPARTPGSRAYYSYAVPALHGPASEEPDMNWSFFVEHFADAARQKQDSKRTARGIFYPRATAMGGCTAHHAMITIYPFHDDWKRLQDLTGDASWSPENMRTYFERVEACRYLPRTDMQQTEDPATRHGFAGWLPVSMPDPTLAFGDPQLLKIILKAFLLAEIATEQRSDLATVLADLRGGPDKRQRATQALHNAVGRLLNTAHKATHLSPDPVRQTIAKLSAQVKGLAERLDGIKDAFNHYAEAPSLLELFRWVHAWLDPNRWFDTDAERVGAFSTPVSVWEGTRSSVRERVLAVRALYPDRLMLLANALAVEVLIENKRAVGIRYIEGAHLYRASSLANPAASLPPAKELRLRERGEIILAGGAFNTPQLLMLSGVGPAQQLRQLGIPVQCDHPGVGHNLHDRYEVGLVSELPQDFTVLEGSRFLPPDGEDRTDRALQEWTNHRGVYASNGVVLSIIQRSTQAENEIPDLCIFGVPGNFRGYYPGYSQDAQSELKNGVRRDNHRRFTWVVLKAKTRNRAGVVSLQSKDPRDPPVIQFKYFEEGSADSAKDLQALVEGVQFAAQLMKATGLQLKTLVPDVNLQDANQVREFVRREAWGHHACGTCKIGTDAHAVLDGDFRVRGVANLRVVDASVFPDIPGFFIVVPIYMISAKAADVILADRRRGQPRPWAAQVAP